jgi:predicted nucleic acid-binding protein
MHTRSGLPGTLVDANVLIYAYDQTEGRKRDTAIKVLEVLELHGEGVLSTQVLGEFFAIVTRKIPNPLSLREAERVLTDFLGSWTVHGVTASLVLEAIRGVIEHQLQYYDSLLWATAALRGIPTIITEDGQHGRTIEGVHYLNPFLPEFDFALLSTS